MPLETSSGWGTKQPNPLIFPRQGDVYRKVKKRYRIGERLIQNRGLDIWSQRGQIDHAADIARVKLLHFGDGREVGNFATFNQPKPPVAPSQGSL
jgi:hypothetical protein